MRNFTDYGLTLTVGELMNALKKYPVDLPVIIEGSHGSGPAVAVEHIEGNEPFLGQRSGTPQHIEIRRYRE